MSNVDKQANTQQIAQAIFDVDTQSVKAVLAGEVGIALSAQEGDSIIAESATIVSQSATISPSTTSGTDVIAEFDTSNVNNINVFSVTTATCVFTNPKLTLELSPVAAGDFWSASALTVTPSATSGAIIAGTALSGNLYKRARVSLSYDAFVSGAFTAVCNTK